MVTPQRMEILRMKLLEEIDGPYREVGLLIVSILFSTVNLNSLINITVNTVSDYLQGIS